MTMRIKNWAKHQHFKDRTPPWIKLYRDILDDPDWHDLDGDSAKILISLWLIASEDDSHNGVLPDDRRLAFRLRISEKQLKIHLNKLANWLIHDDIDPISEQHQSDAPERAGEETETETETEGETDTCAAQVQRNGLMDRFERFYAEYPKKKNRGDAEKAWRALKPDEDVTEKIIAAVKVARTTLDWTKEGGQFAPYPAKWLRVKGWEDQIDASQTQAPQFRVIGGMRVGKNWV